MQRRKEYRARSARQRRDSAGLSEGNYFNGSITLLINAHANIIGEQQHSRNQRGQTRNPRGQRQAKEHGEADNDEING